MTKIGVSLKVDTPGRLKVIDVQGAESERGKKDKTGRKLKGEFEG